MKSQTVLQKAGLLNCQTEDFGVLAQAKARLCTIAFCDSDVCCTYSTVNESGRQVMKRWNRREKIVQKGSLGCPDCGSALFFKQITDRG